MSFLEGRSSSHLGGKTVGKAMENGSFATAERDSPIKWDIWST